MTGIGKRAIRRLCRAFPRMELWLTILRCYGRDARRYLSFSTTLRQRKGIAYLETAIIAHCHVLEKGLALKEPRLQFGKAIRDSLLGLLSEYRDLDYPANGAFFKAAVACLNEYVRFHEENGCDMASVRTSLSVIAGRCGSSIGGVKEVTSVDIKKRARQGFEELVRSRYSIRCFSAEPVSMSLIKQAICLAQCSPSACNRQSSRVYVVESTTLKTSALELQQGNRGFGDTIDKLLVITSDVRSFFDISERKQALLDGGMFAMTLLYGLHYLGVGACTLNWPSDLKRDAKIRALVSIPDHEECVVMIGIGNFTGTFKVAESVRRPSAEIVRVL